MKPVFTLFLSLLLLPLLSGCLTSPERQLPDMGKATVTVPHEQTALCAPLPKFEDREYSDTELREVLNTWISEHEKCASKHKVLSSFVIQMYGKPPQ